MQTTIRALSTRRWVSFERWSAPALAILTALMGVVNLLSATSPALPGRLAILRQISPLEVRHGSHLTSVLAGFALLVLSVNLWRRKQVAWGITMAILAISIVTYLLRALQFEAALLAGGLLLLLWLARHQFYALSDRPSIRQGVIAMLGALAFTLAYGTAGFYMLDRHFSIRFRLFPALVQTVTMFTAFYDPGLMPITGFGRYFADSIYAVGLSTFAYGTYMLVRPVLLRQPATAEERQKALSLVQQYGRTSLARFCLFDDKSYFFGPGQALIAFVQEGRQAIALGDPIGPPEAVLPAIQAFQASCAKQDWKASFYHTLPDFLALYHQCGFDSLCIGHEAVVNLAAFTLEGRENKGLRTSLNKLTKLGYWAEMLMPPITSSVLDELRSISREWLTMRHGHERRFSTGWFDDEYVRQESVMVVHAPEGALCAFANVLSEYQKNEIVIDLMRRRASAPGGTMDFLFVSLFHWAKAQGYSTFSLGLSALSGVGADSSSPVPEKALHYVYEHIDQFYNFKGLHEFKAKYHPAWEPRYLVYPGVAGLLDVITALARADAGGSLVSNYLRDSRRRQGFKEDQDETGHDRVRTDGG